MRRIKSDMTTIYFRDPNAAAIFAMQMGGDVTEVRGDHPYAVTFPIAAMM